MEADDAGPIGPIQLTAPDGEKIWTIVELQGSIEAKEGALDGQELGQITQRPDVSRPRPAPRAWQQLTRARAGRRGSCRSGLGCR